MLARAYCRNKPPNCFCNNLLNSWKLITPPFFFMGNYWLDCIVLCHLCIWPISNRFGSVRLSVMCVSSWYLSHRILRIAPKKKSPSPHPQKNSLRRKQGDIICLILTNIEQYWSVQQLILSKAFGGDENDHSYEQK